MTIEISVREMVTEEVYKRYEPQWSAWRVSMGYSPLPKTFQGFQEYMGWI